MYVCMYLDAAFLLPALGMPADTLEQKVGEQGYGSGVYDLQAGEPGWDLPFSAVRGKFSLEAGIKAAVSLLKHLF